MNEPPASPYARAGQFLARHQGLVVPLAYLALMLLGMFHSWLFFINLGVNILDFADPGDFLLAPLRDPLVILVSIAPLPVFWLLGKSDRLWLRWRASRGKTPEDTARTLRRTRQLNWLGIALWFLAFSLHYANWRGDRIKEGGGSRVTALLANGERLAAPGDSTVALVGTTTRYVLLYAAAPPRSGRLHIVPVDQIARLSKVQKPRRRGAATAVSERAAAPVADSAAAQ